MHVKTIVYAKFVGKTKCIAGYVKVAHLKGRLHKPGQPGQPRCSGLFGHRNRVHVIANLILGVFIRRAEISRLNEPARSAALFGFVRAS